MRTHTFRPLVFSPRRPYLSPRARTRIPAIASAASADAHGAGVYRHQRLGVRAALALAAAASDVRFAGVERRAPVEAGGRGGAGVAGVVRVRDEPERHHRPPAGSADLAAPSAAERADRRR